MAKINIGATKSALSTFSQSYADIGDKMSGINGDYFNGIDKYWDTQTAYKYFSSMAKSLNGTIKSMNSAFKEACDCIQKAADNIASAEGGEKVGTVSFSSISNISIEWQGKDDGYNIPLNGETAELTKNKFTTPMSQVKESCKSCRQAMINIKDSGLGKDISGDAIDGITSMIDKVKEIMAEYDSNAVSSASNEDANAKGYKINTGN